MREAPIWCSRIESRKDVMVGKPCIRGTRVTVEAILNSVGVTGSVQAITAEYPHITEEAVRAPERRPSVLGAVIRWADVRSQEWRGTMLDMSRIEADQIDDGTTYDLYVPSSINSGAAYRLLVSVLPRHPAIARYRPLELFQDFADKHGRLILAPHFDYNSGFQRLGIGADVRYDLRLLRMVDHIGHRYPRETARFDLFGYSAGGQFAHRFLYLHPDRIGSIAVGAPGTVTLASMDRDWPTGIAHLAKLSGADINLAEIRSRHILLFVGDRDVTSEALEQTEEANLLGRTRVERARSLHASWVEAGIAHTYIEVPGMGHPDLDQGIGSVREFFAAAH